MKGKFGIQGSRQLLAKNTLWMTIGLLIRAILQIAYFLIVARTLKPAEYGTFAGVLALVTVLSPFVSWGSGNILVEHVSRQPDQFKSYWGMALSVSILSALLLCLISFGIAILIFSVKIALYLVIPISIGTFWGEGFANLAGQAFQAHQKLSRTAFLNVSVGIFRLIGALLLVLSISKTAGNWSIFYMVSGLFSGTLGLIWVGYELGWGKLGMKLMHEKWAEGFYFAIGISAQGTYNDIDKTLLSRLSTNSIAGLYTAAYRIIDASFMPMSAVLSSTYPNFFKKGEKGIKGTSEFALKLLPWAVGWGAIAMVGIILCAPLLPLILGKDYAETSSILLWLSPIPLFRSFHYLAADSLTGSGYQKYRSGFQIGIALLNLILNLWWIPLYGWIGAARSSLISDGLLAVCLWGLTFAIINAQKKALPGRL